MKIVIANPPWPGEGFGARTNVRWPHKRGDKCLAFPIYLAYASSLLKENDFNVFAIDAVEKEQGIFEFVSLIAKEKPTAILLEISTPSLSYDLEAAQLLKSQIPDVVIVVCGPHATHFHKDLIRDYNFIDICIRGEFELAFLDICRALRSKGSLDSVAGIAFREKHKTIVTKERAFNPDLDSMPYPDRISFKIEDYRQAFYSGKKTALMISSRGCPFNCTFCLWPSTVGGKKFRARTAKNVVDEIQYLVNKLGVDEIIFDDDTFTLDNQRVKNICSEIISRNLNIKWLCMGRVNTVDEDLLKIMKEAGCYQITYGFESGSEKILSSIKKGITKDQIRKAVKLTKSVGLSVAGSFVFGMPDESKETINETLAFAKELNADYVQFALAAPFPGTAFFNFVKQHNLLLIDSWSDLDGTKGLIANTLYLKREELQGLIRHAYIRYYTSPKVIYANLRNSLNHNNFPRLVKGAGSVLSRIFYYKK